MFGSDRLDTGDAALAAAAQATADMLGQAMAAVMAAGQLPPASLQPRLLLAWSAVHGYATLVTEGQCNQLFGLAPDKPQAAQAAATAMLALLGPALAQR